MQANYFEDSKGNKSSTRLKTFLAAMSALVIALSSVFLSQITLGDSLPLIITLLAYSAGEKSFQNALEMKNNK